MLSKWIEPFSGLSEVQFARLVALVRHRGGDVQRGRPWRLPLEDCVLLVATCWRTNLTLRQVAPPVGVSKSAADRILDHLAPRLAIAPAHRPRKDTVYIVDGTLVPTRERSVAAFSKNYRHSTNLQVVIDADSRLRGHLYDPDFRCSTCGMRRRDNGRSWCVAGIVFGLVLVGLGAWRIGPAHHREHQQQVVSACIAERGVEQCLPVRTVAITKIVRLKQTFGGDVLDVYLDGASEPAFTISPHWSERDNSTVVVAELRGKVWAWQESAHHRWEELYEPWPLWTLIYLGLILVGGWFVLNYGSELLIDGPSRYTELAERLVATYSGVSFAGMAILVGFSLSWIFGLAFIVVVAGAVGVNGADTWRHWRSAWRRVRRVPR